MNQKQAKAYQECWDMLLLILEGQTAPYNTYLKQWSGFSPHLLESLYYLATIGIGPETERQEYYETHIATLIKQNYLRRVPQGERWKWCREYRDDHYFTTWPYPGIEPFQVTDLQWDLLKIIGPLLNFETFVQLHTTPYSVRSMLDHQLSSDNHPWVYIIEKAASKDRRYRLGNLARYPVLYGTWHIPSEFLSTEVAAQIEA